MAFKTDIDLAALVTGAFFVRNAFIVISVALFGLRSLRAHHVSANCPLRRCKSIRGS